MELTDRVGLVVGASSGIGRATAKALSDEGVRVGLAARREGKLEEVAEGIEADGGEAAVVPADIRDQAQVEAMIETVRERFGGLHILVNSAGVGHRSSVVDADLDKWRRDVETNLLGMMFASQLAVNVMLEQGTGHVITVSSLAGRKPYPGVSGYAAAKYGITGFSKTLREELMEEGIRVTLIEPGVVDTPLQPDEVREMDVLEPSDVAAAVVYAASQPDNVNVNSLQLQETLNLV